MKALLTILAFVVSVATVSAYDFHYIQTPHKLDKKELLEEVEQAVADKKKPVIKLHGVRPPDGDDNTTFAGKIELADGEEIAYICDTDRYEDKWERGGSLWYEITVTGETLMLDCLGSSKPR